MSNNRIHLLIDKHLESRLSEAEQKELVTLLQQGKNRQLLATKLNNELQEGIYDLNENNELRNRIFRQIQSIITTEQTRETTGRFYGIKKIFSLPLTIAAAVLMIAGLSFLFLFLNNPDKKTQISSSRPVLNDIKAPDKSRASIRLADGTIVYLDSAANGNFAIQENIQLVKLPSGQIVYKNADGTITNTLQYNTLSNPRGSKVIDIQLADGSRVWLNAGSSLTFPVAFVGNERKVAVTGEAYFEITHDKNKPFYVSENNMTVAVLGTHFNIKAYNDEPDAKVTLLEGKVRIITGAPTALTDNTPKITPPGIVLQPSQQALVKRTDQATANTEEYTEKTKVYTADIDAVMAWKNNKFVFDNATITEVMKMIDKWYDVDVEYRGKPSKEEFVGTISRDVNLSQILSLLSETKVVDFEVKGKKVIVK